MQQQINADILKCISIYFQYFPAENFLIQFLSTFPQNLQSPENLINTVANESWRFWNHPNLDNLDSSSWEI